MIQILSSNSETPPHTWRKSVRSDISYQQGGNTSTYVEKIIFESATLDANQKHLHIRGENDDSAQEASNF